MVCDNMEEEYYIMLLETAKAYTDSKLEDIGSLSLSNYYNKKEADDKFVDNSNLEKMINEISNNFREQNRL